MVELIVVLVILAILGAVAIPTIKHTAESGRRPGYIAAGTAIWHGVDSYRVDHHGELPTLAMLQGGGASLRTFDDGQPYVQHWPGDPHGGGPLAVSGGSGSIPSLTGAPESVSYARSGDGFSGWLVAYDGNGRLAMRRIVAISATTAAAPVG